MRKLLTGISALLLFAAGTTSAQKVWTLEECIRHAQENNIQIKRQELMTEVSKNDHFQSKMNLLPDLGAGWNHQFGSGRTLSTDSIYRWVNTNVQEGSMGIQSEMNLFRGFRDMNAISKSKFDLKKSLADLDKAKNDISMNIAAGYLQVLLDEELYQVAKSQVELTQLQVERNKKLVEVGNVARGNLLEMQAQLAREQVNLTNAQNSQTIDYLTLTQMLELDSVGDFKIYHPENLTIDESVPLQSVQDIYAAAEANMPEVKSSEYELESRKKDLAIQKGALSPSLSLQALYYTRYNPDAVDYTNPQAEYTFTDQLKDKKYKQLSLNLSVPIFNRFNTRTNISNSKIAVEDAEYSLVQTKKVLYKTIQQAHADAKAAYDNFVSRREAVVSSEEAFKYTQQKYEVGLSSAVDFNIAKNNLSKAKSDFAQAKYEYIFKTKILDFYKGTPLKI